MGTGAGAGEGEGDRGSNIEHLGVKVDDEDVKYSINAELASLSRVSAYDLHLSQFLKKKIRMCRGSLASRRVQGDHI